MAILSVRINDHLNDELKKAAKAKGITLSEYVKSILRSYHLDEDEDTTKWKMIAWNLFNINADSLRYAMQRSDTVEEFFSIVGKYATNLKIKVIPPSSLDRVYLQIEHSNSAFIVDTEKARTKEGTIAKVVNIIDDKIMEAFYEGE